MSAFEDFIQVELPRRPWSATDPAQETIPVRRGAGPRQLEFIELTDGQVVGKVAGTIQGINISGLGGKSYVHDQPVALFTWNIAHNQNSEDFVAYVTDLSGEQIFPNSITTDDADNVTVEFNSQQTGKVVFIFAT